MQCMKLIFVSGIDSNSKRFVSAPVMGVEIGVGWIASAFQLYFFIFIKKY